MSTDSNACGEANNPRLGTSMEPESPARFSTSAELYARVLELEKAIHYIVSQRADDLCWGDVYIKLGKLIGLEITPEILALLPVEVTDSRCQRYFRSLRGGAPYDKDFCTERVKELEAQVELLQRDLKTAADRIADQAALLARKAEKK